MESGHDIMKMVRHTLYTRVKSGHGIMAMVRHMLRILEWNLEKTLKRW